MELPGKYEPCDIESALYQWWDDNDLFHAEVDDPGEPFSIVIPPPNVTGSLHIGHALVNTLQDVVIRRARMQGKNAVWVPGTDHAGIATQTRVEKMLAERDGTTRHDLGREAFLEEVWAWREQYGGRILTQLRALGASCDWEREAFTFDEPRSAAVRKVFCHLYDEGLIYRGNRLINWDPVANTALSDVEVEHQEVVGSMTHMRYRGSDGGDGVVVATTRPETLLGDTAVAVNPDDPRYADMVGTTVIVPFVDRAIPIIADDHVDPEFGTGAVKVTPAHDPNDYAIGQRHDLEFIDVMNDDATINHHGGPFEGMDRFDARDAIQKKLDEAGLLIKIEEHVHAVGHSSRSHVPIEPRLSDQWFVDVGPLKEKALQHVRAGELSFVPDRTIKTFTAWLENLHDWCISRQLWWGHRIPAWYDAEGTPHVFAEDPTDEEIAELGLTHQEEDVLDTWFSSQLWPFVVFGWPDQTPELDTWFPTDVLITGYDINSFWVSRMVMISLYFFDQLPFHTVFNNGLVRDEQGRKMSKSLDNVIDPLDVIDEYGADALRYSLLRACSPGQDQPLAIEWVEGGKRFANKLWNVTKLVSMRAGEVDVDAPLSADLRLEDRWILSRLTQMEQVVNASYDKLDLAPAARALYHFIWDEFADWYLELAKLRDDDAAKHVLVHVLDRSVTLLHPLMPFVTETIWRSIRGCGSDDGRSVMVNSWPEPLDRRDEKVEKTFETVVDAVTELRKLRAEYNVAPSKKITVRFLSDDGAAEPFIAAADGISRLANAESFDRVLSAPEGLWGTVLVGPAELYVDLEGLVDPDAERKRLERELVAAENELGRAEAKLKNESFVSKAPENVVQMERDKVAEWTAVIAQLREQLGGGTEQP